MLLPRIVLSFWSACGSTKSATGGLARRVPGNQLQKKPLCIHKDFFCAYPERWYLPAARVGKANV